MSRRALRFAAKSGARAVVRAGARRVVRGAMRGLVLGGAIVICACAGPQAGAGDDGEPGSQPGPAASDPRELVPDWVDEAPTRAGGTWTVVGVGSGADDAAAVADALSDARRQLQTIQREQLDDTLALARAQLDDAPAVISARLSFDELRAEALRELDTATPVGEPYLDRLADAFTDGEAVRDEGSLAEGSLGEGSLGDDSLGEAAPPSSSAWLRISLAEDALYPDEALRRLIKLEDSAVLTQRLLEETVRAEALGRIEWAHLAAALAERTRSESPDLLLRLARFHRRSGHSLVAKRLLDRARLLVSPLQPGDPGRRQVEQFALELFEGVPALKLSGKALRELSRASLRAAVLERGRGRLRRPAPTTWYLNLEVKQPGRRLLALWVEEGELRRLELPRDGAVEGVGPYHLGLALDADFSGALLMIWALPATSDVWRAADALSDRALNLGAKEDGGEDPRLRLHTLVRTLEELAGFPDVGALVVDV